MYSKADLKVLMDKAKDFDYLKYMPITWFYRDMKKEYYDQILNRGEITVCLKDENGDPRSPINGRVQGTNFQVNVHHRTGQPMNPSIYGNRRIKIPADDIWDTCPNLYFADFYCYGNGSGHHVTLVMTEDESSWDRFCWKRLPKLDAHDNPFLIFPYSEWKSPKVLSNGIWVEVVVTTNLTLSESDELGRVKWSHRYKNIVPRDKDPHCPHCNIY
ncbi:hypothetical protein CAPTEDRAFT_192495 [Capitella teleta]|uniref:Phytanoyl-CoA hydroxylase-interacting protein-like C-terminal domain-containing protein n=1 Tax=Capitella teleta TaxID=283909 RepID=R7U343_CAPTE|nr:hypothetical protein CAPTEDRAFT_192495 [Capitella teleta]|eukprot:ELU00399.1 hypothetical protein CAPTEDRAFT_192495 [Capitella teleta]